VSHIAQFIMLSVITALLGVGFVGGVVWLGVTVRRQR
jgi:hypothetical protein